MNVCTYEYIYACMYACMHACVHVCVLMHSMYYFWSGGGGCGGAKSESYGVCHWDAFHFYVI